MNIEVVHNECTITYTQKKFSIKDGVTTLRLTYKIPGIKLYTLQDIILVNRIGVYSNDFLQCLYINAPVWFKDTVETYAKVNRLSLCMTNLTFVHKYDEINDIVLDLRNYDNSAFSHFIFESFQKIFAIKQVCHEKITVILSDTHRQYATELIKMLFPNFSIKIKKDSQNVFFKNVVCVSPVAHNNIYSHPLMLIDMRRHILNSIKTSNKSKYPKLVYIDRNDERSNVRKIYNEMAIKEIAKNYGFEVYTIGKLPFEEKIELLTSADIIIGQYGGGLQLSFVCRPRTKILLLQSPHFFRNQISQNELFEIEVLNIVGQQCTAEEENQIKISASSIDKPFRINEQEFDAALQYMIDSIGEMSNDRDFS